MTLIAALAAVIFLSACDEEPLFGSSEGERPQTLVVSATWQQSAEAAESGARLAELQEAIDELRTATGSGWVGRQDDVTGYLTELSGGRFFADPGADASAVIEAFLDAYGPRLFGIGYRDLEFGEAEPPDANGSSVIRAQQVLEGVPVLDGTLIVTIGDAEGEPRVNALGGRVFPGVSVDTEPSFPARKAAAAAKRLSGGTPQGKPRLVITPGEGGQLAWEVAVVGTDQEGDELTLADGLYYISASDGNLLNVRPASAHAHAIPAYGPQIASIRTGSKNVGSLRTQDQAASQSVLVNGDNPIGGTFEAHGLVTGTGQVSLVDTTVPTYDPATGKGGIYTYDAGGSDDESQLPGQLYVSNSTTIEDPEALAAQALSRVVYDFYAELGRSSWDGAGGSLISTVNFGGDNFCNSFFSGSMQPPQMVYGNPCAPGGTPAELTEVEIDTAGHEITHGVTDTSAGLIYSGQSGALNESFSDYLGNVIGNRFKGSDTAEMFEGGCSGYTSPTPMCKPNPEGGLSLRYMLNGNTFEDYLYILNPPYRLRVLGVNQDSGGVHLNSSIWNNALWSIRTRLAQIDGASGNDSKLASDFDKIVFAALTRKLGPSSGFFDARSAIEETTVEAGADPEILRVAKETFDFNKICSGCADPAPGPGQIVSSAPQTQLAPSVFGDEIAWLDLNEGDGIFGFPAQAGVGKSPTNLAATPETAQVVFAGDSVITLELPGTIARYDAAGAKQAVDEIGLSTLAAGLGGSDVGAAWVSMENKKVKFIDPAGSVTAGDLPNLGGASVVAVGTGSGTVAMGTDTGSILVWQPGGEVGEIGTMPGAVLAVAAYGDNVLAVNDAGTAAVFNTSSGAVTEVSEDAIPFGAAMNADYAVWTNSQGELEGGVARTEDAVFPDTDLYMYSFGTGIIYDLLPQRGQQGFPALSGDRIVWQDAVFGGDDILTATIPSGL